MPTCPSCGEANPERARFCLACGSALASEGERPQKTRKTVTILFSDMVDSTPLGEQLDPEALQAIKSRYFDEVRSVLERHGGTVEKFIGDAVMAAFGIPVVHEDDALRAVRAAAEVRDAVSALNDALESERGLRIATRTGINTGEVVAGDVSERQSFATGDAVNVAARLEGAAQAGEILVGETTYRLVRDAVQVEELEPLALKGKTGGIQAFRLLEVSPGAAGHRRRLDSPMVGREREHARLRQAFDQACRDKACHLFTLLGSAGVGKSRLVEDFVAVVSPTASVMRGRCLPYGEGITFWPVVEALKDGLGLSDEEAPEASHHKIASVLEGDEGELVADRLGQLLGLDSSSATNEEAFWALRKIFEGLAARRPLVVVFDDIHWGEPTFLDLVEYVADWSRDAPMMVVCLARPELLDLRPGWAGGKLNATTLLLQPLTEGECAKLIENLLGRARLAPPVQQRITEAAEGNPLFVEEMVGMLIDEGALERDNGSWVPVGDLSEVAVPPTIQALLAARLDRLASPERAVIERASVEGKIFHRGAVAELAPEALQPEVPAHLMSLLRKELIRPTSAGFAGEEAFRFRHILIRDAAYSALSKETRADLHERFAAWLERMTRERASEYEEILGYHFEQAYLCRAAIGPEEATRGLGQRAVGHLARAGKRALTRGDAPAAITLLERAQSLPAEEPRARVRLLLDLADGAGSIGELERAEGTLQRAVDEARSCGSAELELLARMSLASARLYIDPEGRGEEILQLAQELIEISEASGDDHALAQAWLNTSEVWHLRNRFEARAEAAQRAVVHARKANDELLEKQALARLGAGLIFGPTPVEDGIRRCREVLASNDRDPRVRGSHTNALAVLEAFRGNFAEARRLNQEARAVGEDFGMLILLVAPREFAFFIEMLAGDAATAEQEMRKGYELLERAGDKSYFSTMAAHLAEAVCAQGRFDEAEEFARISEEAGASDDVVTQYSWRLARAKVLSHRGEHGAAEALAREAVALTDETDSTNARADGRFDLAQVLRLADRREEVRPLLEEALRLYEQKGNVVSADRTRRLLDDVA